MKEQLWHVLVGTNGGEKRARVLRALEHRPASTSQLADRLDEHYNTIRYHLDVLEEKEMVTPSGDDYGAVYFLTEAFEEHAAEFEEITDHLDVSG